MHTDTADAAPLLRLKGGTGIWRSQGFAAEFHSILASNHDDLFNRQRIPYTKYP